MTHEELPQQPRPVILNHHGYRALVDGEVASGIPVVRLAEGIIEAIGSEDFIAHLVEMPHHLQRSGDLGLIHKVFAMKGYLLYIVVRLETHT